LGGADILDKKFLMDHLPEPYLQFETANNPLYVLTTNPGKGREFQNRESIRSKSSFISCGDQYIEIAFKLGEYYRNKLEGKPLNRIEGFLYLAKKIGNDGVVQLESCPFHSAKLPNKTELIPYYETEPLLKEYATCLQKSILNLNILALSAVNSKKDISVESITSNPWLEWQAHLMGFNFERVQSIPLTKKTTRVTSALIYSQEKSGLTKGFILMMGSNNLPHKNHLGPVVKVWTERN
jgi:hypothetical protein